MCIKGVRLSNDFCIDITIQHLTYIFFKNRTKLSKKAFCKILNGEDLTEDEYMLLKKDGPKDLYTEVQTLEKTARWTRISKYIQDQGPRSTTVLDLSKVSLKGLQRY